MKDHDGAAPSSPGALFVELWTEAVQWGPDDRRFYDRHEEATIKRRIEDALDLDDGAEAAARLYAVIHEASGNTALRSKRVLNVMRAIDQAFTGIHPRPRISTTPCKARVRQRWLEKANTARLETGAYIITSSGQRLIARGPLLRLPRDEEADSADTLADRFSALAVAQNGYLHDGRPILITQKVILNHILYGVRPGSRDGEEKIAFFAVAETADDIQIEDRSNHDKHYLDYRAAGSLDVAGKIIAGLEAAGSVDIAMAPELVVSEKAADDLCARIAGNTLDFRLLIAGSGHTDAAADNGMHWNESRVVNHEGIELWRHRKFWPASIPGEDALELGVAGAAIDQRYCEYNAAGNEVQVVDLDSLGRCIVVICQDILADTVLTDLIQDYQPDWVLAPILDGSISIGRWAHRRAFNLGSRSPTRFMFTTSTSFSNKLSAPGKPFCMAVSHRFNHGDDKERRIAPLSPEPGCPVEIATVQWRSGCAKWLVDTLNADPIA